MKKALFSVILLTTFLNYSQQKQFSINWNGTRVLSTESSKVEVPSFNKSNFSFDHISGLKYINQWSTNELVNESSLRIINVFKGCYFLFKLIYGFYSYNKFL